MHWDVPCMVLKRDVQATGPELGDAFQSSPL